LKAKDKEEDEWLLSMSLFLWLLDEKQLFRSLTSYSIDMYGHSWGRLGHYPRSTPTDPQSAVVQERTLGGSLRPLERVALCRP
jgi:hypothetical protein